jgi:DNA-binding NarL/FixJ family response regulator
MIRVLIAEDHPVVRTGLEQLLRATEDMEIAGVAEDGEQAVALARDSKPDVVLMDLVMPGLDGVGATQRIVAADPGARVVVLTSFADRKRILAALDGGAVGYLLKDADPEELLRGIRSAAQGQSPLAPLAASALLDDRQKRRSAEEQLTERELDVLALVGDGLPNKLIARRLEISEKTVKAHLTRVFSVLGVTDRTQAALWAQRNDIISREP